MNNQLASLPRLARLYHVEIAGASVPRRKRKMSLKVQWLIILPVELLLLALMLWTKT